MTQMGFYFDQTRCTGCYTCAVACKDWHDIDAGPANWMRVRALESGTFPDLFVAYLASPCYHCGDPPCAGVCPADAITKTEPHGIVSVDREKCLGNRECDTLCRKACPWDAPQFGAEPAAKMQKCDFCRERRTEGRQTVCVEACPMFALDAGPLTDLQAKYGNEVEAEGFRYSERCKPSVTFKPKKRTG
jgi:anaerobic dimethyl sulfoxide reductase subunit B (iron-sulfur subunit)